MFKSIFRRQTLAITAVAFAASAATVPAPTLAASGDCETYNRIKCTKYWPGRYGQYATLEDCIEGETALGNCPGGGGRPGETPPHFALFVKHELPA